MRKIKSKTVVIKIGTNTLTSQNGLLDRNVIEKLVLQIASIKNKRNIIIITSGAIGAGMQELGLNAKPKDVITKQVCAGIGQNILMHNYYLLFRKHGIKIAQILLTYRDLAYKETYKNLTNSLRKMLELGVIPIINENDPISIREIGSSFGDNDNLSAMIASRIKADLLIMLTNVDGLFSKNPNENGALLIREVKKINKRIESMGSGSSALGIGGMKTKIQAAKTATGKGTAVIIANGRKENILIDILSGNEVGTIFYSK